MNGSIHFIVGSKFDSSRKFKGLFESMQRSPDYWKVTEVEMFWSEMFEMCIGLVHALTDQ